MQQHGHDVHDIGPALHAGQDEQVLDKPLEPLQFARDVDEQFVAGGGVELIAATQQDLGPAEDRGDRGAQLVRQDTDEAVAQGVGIVAPRDIGDHGEMRRLAIELEGREGYLRRERDTGGSMTDRLVAVDARGLAAGRPRFVAGSDHLVQPTPDETRLRGREHLGGRPRAPADRARGVHAQDGVRFGVQERPEARLARPDGAGFIQRPRRVREGGHGLLALDRAGCQRSQHLQ